jgi:hypothetical protein
MTAPPIKPQKIAVFSALSLRVLGQGLAVKVTNKSQKIGLGLLQASQALDHPSQQEGQPARAPVLLSALAGATGIGLKSLVGELEGKAVRRCHPIPDQIRSTRWIDGENLGFVQPART